MVVPLLLALATTFLFTFFGLKYWIRAAKRAGLVGRDVNKLGEIYVAESGGMVALFGLIIGVSVYLLLLVLMGQRAPFLESYALLLVTSLIALLGFTDDILGWKKGLPKWLKPVLTLILSLPLSIVIFLNPQYNTFPVPLWLYALLIVPIGITGASNAVNMLAGYNGLEAGLSLVILLFLGLKAFLTGQAFVAHLALIAMASLLAFLYYNWYPAKVFPGDSLTYAMGAFIASLAVLGNLELFAAALFSLYFLDLFIKLPHGFRRVNRVVPQPDGTLRLEREGVYSLTNLVLKLLPNITERGLVASILLLQVLVGLVVLALF